MLTRRWNDAVPELSNHMLAMAADGAEMKITLLWAIVILAFGVLMMICVLLLLKRHPDELAQWEGGGSPAKSGRYLQHLSRLLRAIRAINNVIISDRQVEQMLLKACRTLTETRGYKMAWIGLVEPGTKRVRPVAEAGFGEGYLEQIQVTWDESPTGRGPTGQAIKTSEPAVMRDIEVAPEDQPWRKQALERGYRSSAALPLRFESRVLGALCVYSDIPNAFDIEEIGLLQEVSDHLAYALGTIKLQEELLHDRERLKQLQPLEAVLEHAPFGVIATNSEGAVTALSPRARDLLGSSLQAGPAAVGEHIAQLDFFASPQAQAEVQKLFDEPGPVRFEQSAGGRRLLCRGVPLREQDGRLTGSLWTIDDASDLA